MKEVAALPIGEWEVDGWRIKTTQGAKGSDDRKVWVASPGGEFHLLSLAALGAITKAWYINEQLLYPRDGQRGGEMVMDFLRNCIDLGLIAAHRRGRFKREPQVRRVA